MKITPALPLVLVAFAGIAAGCSGGPSTPVAPAAVTSDASAESGGASRGTAIEISGTVARVSGACPALRFLVGGVTVETGRATVFTGGTCANVVNGAGIVATGARQSDGSLAASSIAVRGTTTR